MISCTGIAEKQISKQRNINGTWLLLSSVTKNGDSSVAENLQGQKMIKIITDNHFAFFRHDLNKGQDSTSIFVAGGGKCSFANNQYNETLEYCNYREWEGLEVEFSVDIRDDTIILTGIEEIEELGVNHEIIETFVKFAENE